MFPWGGGADITRKKQDICFVEIISFCQPEAVLGQLQCPVPVSSADGTHLTLLCTESKDYN